MLVRRNITEPLIPKMVTSCSRQLSYYGDWLAVGSCGVRVFHCSQHFLLCPPFYGINARRGKSKRHTQWINLSINKQDRQWHRFVHELFFTSIAALKRGDPTPWSWAAFRRERVLELFDRQVVRYYESSNVHREFVFFCVVVVFCQLGQTVWSWKLLGQSRAFGWRDLQVTIFHVTSVVKRLIAVSSIPCISSPLFWNAPQNDLHHRAGHHGVVIATSL